eukprot:10000318-Alexandrium_andersonii.AAC.1
MSMWASRKPCRAPPISEPKKKSLSATLRPKTWGKSRSCNSCLPRHFRSDVSIPWGMPKLKLDTRAARHIAVPWPIG